MLELITKLVPHLHTADDAHVGESLAESRDIAVRLLAVFWKYTQEGHYSQRTRMAVAQCMTTFAQVLCTAFTLLCAHS